LNFVLPHIAGMREGETKSLFAMEVLIANKDGELSG